MESIVDKDESVEFDSDGDTAGGERNTSLIDGLAFPFGADAAAPVQLETSFPFPLH